MCFYDQRPIHTDTYVSQCTLLVLSASFGNYPYHPECDLAHTQNAHPSEEAKVATYKLLMHFNRTIRQFFISIWLFLL